MRTENGVVVQRADGCVVREKSSEQGEGRNSHLGLLRRIFNVSRSDNGHRPSDHDPAAAKRVLIAAMSKSLLASGRKVVSRAPGDAESLANALLLAYLESLTRLVDRDGLRELVSASLWPGSTLSKQLLLLKVGMIGQIAEVLDEHQIGQPDGTTSHSDSAFVVYCVFAGVLSIYLQDEKLTVSAAERIMRSAVARVFRRV